MRQAGPPVQRSDERALWLGRATLIAAFGAVLLGGAVGAWEALALSAVPALLAAGAWVSVGASAGLRRHVAPALAWTITVAVVGWTSAPVLQNVVRAGLYAPVGGDALSIAPTATLIETAKLGGLGCAFLCGVFAGRGRRTPPKLLDLCVALTAVWAAWSLVLFVSGGSEGRLGAPLGSPNTAASLLGVGGVLATGQLLALPSTTGRRANRRWKGVWLGCALVVTVVALCLTQSRAGLVAALLAGAGLLLFWPIQGRQHGRSVRWVGAGACGLAVLALVQTGGGVLVRLAGLAEDAADRGEIFTLYWRAFLDAPLFGAGLGASTYVSKLGLTPENYDALWNIQSAHNWALQWLAEGGIAATLPMVCAVAMVLIGTLRGLDVRSAAVLLPLLFADALVLAHGLTDFALQIPAFALYWSFLLGLQAAVAGRPSLPPAGGADPAPAGESRP
nr:O-antigen ligase family protein [uncultured Brevundimonas sp.]